MPAIVVAVLPISYTVHEPGSHLQLTVVVVSIDVVSFALRQQLPSPSDVDSLPAVPQLPTSFGMPRQTGGWHEAVLTSLPLVGF